MTTCYICGNHSAEYSNILEGRAQHSGKMLKELIGMFLRIWGRFFEKFGIIIQEGID